MKTQEQRRELNREKNINYPRVSFRVSGETSSELRKLKGNLSWNLFFVEMIKSYKKFGRPKK